MSTAEQRKIAMMKLVPGLILQMVHPDGADWEAANDLLEDYYVISNKYEESLGQFMVAAGILVKNACDRGGIDPVAFLQEHAAAWATVPTGLPPGHKWPGEISTDRDE